MPSSETSMTNVLAIVKEVLTPNARNDAEQIAFYERMKGDFIRYEIEIAASNQKETLHNEANHCYMAAKELAENHLPAYHPVRVGIMLNYSVFCFNSKSKADNALKIAKQAYEVILRVDCCSCDLFLYRGSTGGLRSTAQ
jgi:14-3-3 protein epsilon